MTQQQLSFRDFLAPELAERIPALTTDILTKVNPSGAPLSADMICGLGQAFAFLAADDVRTDTVTWNVLKQLFAEMRAHVMAQKKREEPQPRRYRKRRFTYNEMHFLRALEKFTDPMPLAVIVESTHLDRKSIKNGAATALRSGLVSLKTIRRAGYYKLTDAGRQALPQVAIADPAEISTAG